MIEVKKLAKYYNGVSLFENVNFEVSKGEMVALMGDSGCGKTTLLNLIGLLDSDYQGDILINNTNIKKENKSKFYRNQLGYLFQNFALIDNNTVSENLDVALKFEKNMSKKQKETLKQSVLDEVNLIGKINSKIYTLSGGEQQKVALARVFLKKCQIVLADEPTGSLDETNRNDILKLLQRLSKKGKTILIVTHDSYVAKHCDRILCFSDLV